MTPNVHVLMCVYNEAAFVDYAIRACVPHVKSITVVEGAYRETMLSGAPARSNDGTLEILRKHVSSKLKIIHANERSDAHQRNVGLEHIKTLDPHGWMLIIDGDEVYEPFTFKLIGALCNKMEKSQRRCAIFKSLTFVNDFEHYCEQFFPRLFQVAPDASFVNDNHVAYGQTSGPTIQCPYIAFHHYSFCKGIQRFLTKKQWWETRFAQPFNYSWHVNDAGLICDPQHEIKQYTGRHPAILADRITNGKTDTDACAYGR